MTVRPGDILVADEDGVVVVPQERAAEILKQAQAIDDRERGMCPFIREFKSLQKAIAKFNPHLIHEAHDLDLAAALATTAA